MSGFVTGIAISNQPPYPILVRTDVGGLYLYDRVTQSWKYLFEKFPTNARAEGVESIAIDPIDPNVFYAAFWRQNTNDGNQWNYTGEVWRSPDRGSTWVNTGLKDFNVQVEPNGEYRAETGERLAIDPNKPDNIWFGSRNNGLWVKRGTTVWAQVSGLPAPTSLFWGGEPRTDKPGFTWVLFDRASGSSGSETPVVYTGAYGSGVWKRSTVGGAWTRITSTTAGDIQQEPLRAAIASNGDLYCVFGEKNQFGSRGSLQRYRNGTWTDITPSGAGAMSGIAVHSDNQQVLVSGNTDIWKSNDAGATWTSCDADLRYPQSPSAPQYMTTDLANNLVVSLAFDPANANHAWFTNGFGVARSFNSNLAVPTWSWEMLGLEEFVGVMTRPVPTPLDNFYIYTTVMDKTGFKTTNLDVPATKNIAASGIPVPADTPSWIVPNGETTFPVPINSTTGCSAIDVAWANPQQAAWVGYHQVATWIPLYGKTADHGETWQAFGSVPTRFNTTTQQIERGRAGQIAVDRRGTDRMVWVPCQFSPYYTIDGGNTWNICKIAGTNTDLHSSWGNNIATQVRSGILESDKRVNGRFYYVESTWQGLLYVSNDAGATWTKTSENQLPTYRIGVTIAPNSFIDNDVWFSFARDTEQVDSKSNKLWRSTNGGQSVSIVQNVDSAEYVAIGKGEGDVPYYVYVFGRIGGATADTMYRSIDLGVSWQQISDPTQTQFNGIVHLAADPRIANLIYTSARGRGHQYSILPGTTVPNSGSSPTPPSPTPSPPSGLHPDTTAWRTLVLANGGAIEMGSLTENQVLSAIDAFVVGCYADELRNATTPADSIISELSALAGGNLLAAVCKLWYPSGVQDKLTLNNLTAANYTVTGGLKPSNPNTSEFADTGFSPSGQNFTNGQGWIAFYSMDGAGYVGGDIGSADNNDAEIALQCNYGDGSGYFSNYSNSSGQGYLQWSSTTHPGTGFYVGSRTSETANRVFRNGVQIAQSSFRQGVPPAQAIKLFRHNDRDYSSRNCGLYAIGSTVLPDALQAALNTRVQTLMTGLGRGI